MHFPSQAIIAAILAAAPFTSGAALQSRQAQASGFQFTLDIGATGPVGESIRELQGQVIKAEKGKFRVGGPFVDRAVIVCGDNGGGNTTCALNAQDGPQKIYIDTSDGLLSYTAPNAPLPPGSNPYFFRRTGAPFMYSMRIDAGRQFPLQDFLACKTPGYENTYDFYTQDAKNRHCPGAAALAYFKTSGPPVIGYGQKEYLM
ncbi:MAG: hypothetical protein M1837_003978 [Sclerophora amabilis]|nr:MAG: hypothetical protein M1837_003978 [Sclerophora amabilis]